MAKKVGKSSTSLFCSSKNVAQAQNALALEVPWLFFLVKKTKLTFSLLELLRMKATPSTLNYGVKMHIARATEIFLSACHAFAEM